VEVAVVVAVIVSVAPAPSPAIRNDTARLPVVLSVLELQLMKCAFAANTVIARKLKRAITVSVRILNFFICYS
jgi:hypothetical protein